MILRTLISSLFICLCSNILIAQNIRVEYNVKAKSDSTKAQTTESTMLLDIFGTTSSRFYAQNLYKSDSIKSSGVTPKTFSINFNNAIIKNNNTLKKYYRILVDAYEVTTEVPALKWEITSEKKKIGDYECQQATLQYKNRQWTAWFTQDIPISEGPFVFKGLPGLIIWIYDNKGNYDFMLNKLIKNFYDPYEGVDFRNHNLVKVTPEQLNKIYLNHYLDPYKEAKMGKVKINFQDEKGNPITNVNWNELAKYKQEEIKQNNNPIELSDAVKYPK